MTTIPTATDITRYCRRGESRPAPSGDDVYGVLLPTGGYGNQARLDLLANTLRKMQPVRQIGRFVVSGYAPECDAVADVVRLVLAETGMPPENIPQRILIDRVAQTTPWNAIHSAAFFGANRRATSLFAMIGRLHQIPRRLMCYEMVGFLNMIPVPLDKPIGNLNKVDYEANKCGENYQTLLHYDEMPNK